ncbi:hypothetical protein WS72_07680 [Burkholderia savannae]|uniref:Lipoprotein n=1 Tax=Burkholderia savannae TaxID=1637837 RepID=A0ABR5TCM9_9BURK|nr:hypothetical protein WS72_07680 [Burkholderia savannae]KWZ45817.1 hypothetical protein WS73_17030 [Burkholderia savannae]
MRILAGGAPRSSLSEQMLDIRARMREKALFLLRPLQPRGAWRLALAQGNEAMSIVTRRHVRALVFAVSLVAAGLASGCGVMCGGAGGNGGFAGGCATGVRF